MFGGGELTVSVSGFGRILNSNSKEVKWWGLKGMVLILASYV